MPNGTVRQDPSGTNQWTHPRGTFESCWAPSIPQGIYCLSPEVLNSQQLPTLNPEDHQGSSDVTGGPSPLELRAAQLVGFALPRGSAKSSGTVPARAGKDGGHETLWESDEGCLQCLGHVHKSPCANRRLLLVLLLQVLTRLLLLGNPFVKPLGCLQVSRTGLVSTVSTRCK